MLTDPRNPDNHGNVPGALVNMIRKIMPVYLADPTQTFPGMAAVYDFAGRVPSSHVLAHDRLPHRHHLYCVDGC
jgi:hypothetical protein